MASIVSTVPDQDSLDEAYAAAFEGDGYSQSDGSINKEKVRSRIFDVLRGRKVTGPTISERAEKAVTRGQMVAAVFPNLPDPDESDLAFEVWKRIDSYLWGECKADAGSAVQRLIGSEMGNGYVLCRTRVGRDQTLATYITDNFQALERDYIGPDTAALERAIMRVVRNRELIITRQPQNSKRVARGLDRFLRAQLTATHERLALTAQSVTEDGTGESEGDES
jgi:hypothetical protein